MSDDHIPMPKWVDVYDSERMAEVCGGCGQDWPCPQARVTPPEVGRCGDEAPSILKGTPAVHCRLPHGHPGWHRGDDDSEWTTCVLPPGGPDA